MSLVRGAEGFGAVNGVLFGAVVNTMDVLCVLKWVM